MFELMRELFEILNARRHRRGSVDFDLPEAQVVLDEEGFIEDIVASERNVAHRLIEEFMLLANETVAGHLESTGMPALYRIHEPPDPLKVLQFEEFISAFGYQPGRAGEASVQPKHFQKLVEKIRGNPGGAADRVPDAADDAEGALRRDERRALRPGRAETYTHFTSPIRRYPDLVVHRLLRELRHTKVSDERKAELDEDLPEVGRHTSEMERRAAEAEREILQWKKVRFMADKVGDVFDGYITGVAPFGMFVELIEHYVEGLVHVTTMADDYYRFANRRTRCSARTPRRPTGWATRCACRSSASTWSAGRSIWASRMSSKRSARDERSRGPARSSARPKKEQRKGTHEERRKRKQRLGKKERGRQEDPDQRL